MKDLTLSPDARLALSLFRAFAEGDLDRWQALLAPDFTYSYPGVPDGRGAAAARAYNQPFADAFGDWDTEVHSVAQDGGTVMLEITVRATLVAPLVTPEGTLPASGRRGAVRAVVVAEIGGGRIRREATYWNVPDLVAQILPAA